MLWFKCSVLLMIFSSNVYADRFTSDECLKASFNATVEHSGTFFGLIKNKLSIDKKECLIKVSFENILETTWVVDLCREPIHMKILSKGSESVYKRDEECSSGDKSDFCVYRNELAENLQDYGLIFAKGERESLTTDHGKTYCTYLLIEQHLDDGILFSKYRPSVDLFSETAKKTKKIETIEEAKAVETGTIDPEELTVEEAPEENTNKF